MNIIGKIIVKSFLYTSPVWLLCIYLEIRLSTLENSYSFKLNAFNKTKDRTEMIILGNSEILKGINPGCMQIAAFNLAHVSQDLTIDEKILRKYIVEIPNLKRVMLGISYISFGDDLQHSDEAWRLAFYKKHYGIMFDNDFDLKDYSGILRYTPYESLKLFTNNFNSNLVNGIQLNGWMKTLGCDTKDTSDLHARLQAKRHTESLRIENMKRNINALRSILYLLKEKNIKLILVRPPVMQNYYQHLDKNWIYRNDSILNVINREFSPDILDFSQRSNLSDPYFANGFNDIDHLNEDGSKHLCKLICDEIMGHQ